MDELHCENPVQHTVQELPSFSRAVASGLAMELRRLYLAVSTSGMVEQPWGYRDLNLPQQSLTAALGPQNRKLLL